MEDKQETLENTNALSTEEMKALVVIGRALADPTRIRILGLLAERPMYGQELAQVLDVKPPTVSHHMEPLVNAGLVREVALEGRVARFDVKGMQHHHFVCDRCGEVEDLEWYEVPKPAAKCLGKRYLRECELIVRGLCARCVSSR